MLQIKLFFFILSIVYLSSFVVELVIKLTQDNTEPMVTTKVEKSLQLIALSYIITYILT
jgi:hypothetical protein